MNQLEEIFNDRFRQLSLANEQRQDIDRIIIKLNEWIKTTEQQIKDPFANDLQQPTNALKDKSKSVQVRRFYPMEKSFILLSFSLYFN